MSRSYDRYMLRNGSQKRDIADDGSEIYFGGLGALYQKSRKTDAASDRLNKDIQNIIWQNKRVTIALLVYFFALWQRLGVKVKIKDLLFYAGLFLFASSAFVASVLFTLEFISKWLPV